MRAENARLLKMLELSSRQAAPPGPAQVGFFDAPPGPVHKDSPDEAKVAFFRALFAARTDIYATRIEPGPAHRAVRVGRQDASVTSWATLSGPGPGTRSWDSLRGGVYAAPAGLGA